MRFLHTIMSLICVLISGSVVGQDVDYFRIAPVDGIFRNPALWTPFDSVPPPPFFFGPGGATDRAQFDTGQSPANRYTVAVVEGINEQLIVGNDSVRLEIDDYETVGTGTNSLASLIIGDGSTDIGDAFFAGGAVSELRSVNVRIARSTGSTGNTTVDGAGFQWSSTGNFLVGSGGDGSLNVINGSHVSSGDATIGGGVFSTGQANVDGSGSNWSSSDDFRVGSLGDGWLQITNGGAVACQSAEIAVGPNSIGIVEVIGPGSDWSMVQDLVVGDGGLGQLLVSNSGSVFNRFSAIRENGMASIDGSGSSWTSLNASFIAGLLQVSDGATVTSNSGGLPDDTSRVEGQAFVSGPGSSWNINGQLQIDSSSDSMVTIDDGGELVCEARLYVGIADFPGGGVAEINVDGTDSAVSCDILEIGGAVTIFDLNGGNGVLLIENGGSVTSVLASIGFGDNFGTPSTGAVNVSGIGSNWSSSIELLVGYSANGTLTINSGASVTSGYSVVGLLAGSTGDVSVSGLGSRWQLNDYLSIGGSSSSGTNGGIGNVTIDNGASVLVNGETTLFPDGVVNLQGGRFASGTIQFNAGGDFCFAGGVLQVGQYQGNLLNEGGILAPGPDTGQTNIFGNYDQQSPGILDIEICGPSPVTEFDFVDVGQTASLDGQLQLTLGNGYEPESLQTFSILNADSIVGSFANVDDGQRLGTTDGAGSFLVRYGVSSPNPSQIILSEFQTFILGDINGDGELNLLDVAPFVALLSSGVFNPAADINGDGEVNLLDVAPFVALLAG